MEMSVELQGVEESFENMARLVAAEEKAVKECLEWLLRAMINYVKVNGPWIDRTSNLRNSISGNIKAMQEWPADTDPKILKAKVRELEDPVIDISGDDYTAVLSAGMEYAIYLETGEGGFWVLQGAIDAFSPYINQFFKDFLAVEKLDLQQIASVQYAKHYSL